MPAGDRRFYVGETVNLVVRTSVPGTKTPLDVTQVRLTALRLNGTAVSGATPQSFTQVAEGDYRLALSTADLDPGTYDLVVTADDGSDAVVVTPDRFVLLTA